MFGIGGQELLIILFLVLILFGAEKVPKFAKGLGEAVREFRKAAKDIGSDDSIEHEEYSNETKKNDADGAFYRT